MSIFGDSFHRGGATTKGAGHRRGHPRSISHCRTATEHSSIREETVRVVGIGLYRLTNMICCSFYSSYKKAGGNRDYGVIRMIWYVMIVCQNNVSWVCGMRALKLLYTSAHNGCMSRAEHYEHREPQVHFLSSQVYVDVFGARLSCGWHLEDKKKHNPQLWYTTYVG